ncbi:MAG: tetratricopeptide repeat protein, partial [Dehalococcoidia bacterium]
EREPELAGRLLACLLNPMQTGSRESGEYARLRQRAHGLVDRHQLPLVAALVTYADAMQLFLFGNGERVLELLRRARGEFDKQGQSNLAMDAQRQVMENLIIIGRLGEAQGALEEMLATARRLHLHGREDESCGGLAGLRLAHAGYADFDTLEAERQYAGGNWNWSMLSPVRWLHVGELERAVAALPDLSAAGNVPNLLVRIGGVRARVLWLAGEQDAARQEWTRLLAMVPGDLHASVIDGVTVSGWAIVASGEALPHLADSAFLAAAAVFLQRREAAGLRWNCQRGTFESYQRQSAMVHLWCGHLEEAQSGLLEALDWCERERCPVEAGRCLQGLAEVAERRGQRQEALGYLERAAALFEQYGAKLYLEQVRATRAGLE